MDNINIKETIRPAVEPILKVTDLHTSFFSDRGEAKAVNGVSFSLYPGRTLGIVGESGSGKSVTAFSIMRLLGRNGKIVSGSIKYKGQEITKWSRSQCNKFRGKHCSVIFQDPMTALNPVFTIGNQIDEAVALNVGLHGAAKRQRTLEILELVGINDPKKRLHQYPHELSGGMRQRVMIAMALVSEPDILIADEPTTALDVTTQWQIMELIADLQKKLGMAMLLVTHDLGVVAQLCDDIVVMYAGRICERGSAEDIFYNPAHLYTQGLLKSIPGRSADNQRLVPIGGTPVNVLNLPEGCAFCPRCNGAMKICMQEKAPEVEVSPGHFASCWCNFKPEEENHE